MVKNREKQWVGDGKILLEIVATNIVASRLSESRPLVPIRVYHTGSDLTPPYVLIMTA